MVTWIRSFEQRPKMILKANGVLASFATQVCGSEPYTELRRRWWQRTNPSLQWLPSRALTSDGSNPQGNSELALHLQVKRKINGKLMSPDVAFYGVRKQQDGTSRDHLQDRVSGKIMSNYTSLQPW